MAKSAVKVRSRQGPVRLLRDHVAIYSARRLGGSIRIRFVIIRNNS